MVSPGLRRMSLNNDSRSKLFPPFFAFSENRLQNTATFPKNMCLQLSLHLSSFWHFLQVRDVACKYLPIHVLPLGQGVRKSGLRLCLGRSAQQAGCTESIFIADIPVRS